MRSELSEFSYGFAVTAELRDRLRPFIMTAPIFPTLVQEEELGWDVKVPIRGLALFLQFKLPEALVRANAGEWSYFGGPYYRFPLHRRLRSNQHNRLKALATTEPAVFYGAPRFHSLLEFHSNYIRERVAAESAWIPATNLPAVNDNYQHHIAFRTGSDAQFFSPERKPVEGSIGGEEWLKRFPHLWESRGQIITSEWLFNLRSSLMRALHETNLFFDLQFPAKREGLKPLLADVAYLARTFFAAEFVLVRESSV